MKMLRMMIKRNSFANIVVKLLITVYLLIVGTYYFTLPTVAYFNDEQKVEASFLMTNEFFHDESEFIDPHDSEEGVVEKEESSLDESPAESNNEVDSEIESAETESDDQEDEQETDKNLEADQ